MDFELIEHDKDDAYDPAPFLSYARLRSQEHAERDPVIGDTVHFWDGAACKAAIMAGDLSGEWDAPTADLAVLRFSLEYGLRWDQEPDVKHDEGKAQGSWHWPCGGR